MQTILLAPNREEKDLLKYVLRQVSASVSFVPTWEEAVQLLRQERPYDLLLAAPEPATRLSEQLVALRAMVQIPILLIIDPPTEDLHCELLDVGVDLVVKRPFSVRILARQIRILLRRTSNVPAMILPTLEINNLILDPTVRTVQFADNDPQRLTQLEFRLLYMLMSNAGRVVTNEELVERVWGYNETGNRGLVRGLVSRLRRKIEPASEQSAFIETLPSIGYRFIEQG